MTGNLNEVNIPKWVEVKSPLDMMNANGAKTNFVPRGFDTTYHWVLLVRPIGWFFAGFVLFIYTGSGNFEGHNYFVFFFGAFLMLVSTLAYLGVQLKLRTSKFSVTKRSLIVEHGFVNRRMSEVPLANIETILVYQGFWAQALNYGTLVIIGNGGTREVYRHIDRAKEFKGFIHRFVLS